ncbi:hypothetical protein KP509_11G041500 [Ceratopteris richardii]|uniref:Uncharacterized protein n=1 Tax=Ceratopteris richardii TaxID=49495 RepID=A0A8T2TNS4_CERRI|nr:hypothetical protein KP509_11G041500 [Ceratopteris richardii]
MQKSEVAHQESDPSEPSFIRSLPPRVVTRTKSFTAQSTRRASDSSFQANNTTGGARNSFRDRAISFDGYPRERLTPAANTLSSHLYYPADREVELVGAHHNVKELSPERELFNSIMPPMKEHVEKKRGISTSTQHAPGRPLSPTSNTHPSQCRILLACKRWCYRRRRFLVWVSLPFCVALAAMVWYHHAKHAREMARKKSKRWWF